MGFNPDYNETEWLIDGYFVDANADRWIDENGDVWRRCDEVDGVTEFGYSFPDGRVFRSISNISSIVSRRPWERR